MSKIGRAAESIIASVRKIFLKQSSAGTRLFHNGKQTTVQIVLISISKKCTQKHEDKLYIMNLSYLQLYQKSYMHVGKRIWHEFGS